MAEKKQREIPKAYDPSVVEDKWYKYWQDNKLFHSEIDESKEPYVIPIPPPRTSGRRGSGSGRRRRHRVRRWRWAR